MSNGQRFPGFGELGVDDRIVLPETRAEIVEGQLHFSPPSDEPHALAHATLAYVLRAYAVDGYSVAVDMLTRTSPENDFAPDASIYPTARDPENGRRRLEELAFEVVSEQPLAVQTSKARELTRRGVRRVFALLLRRKRCIEWSPATDDWAASPIATIEDRCFATGLGAAALLDATLADASVVQALRARQHPALEAIRDEGWELGRTKGREEGLAKGLEEGRARGLADGLAKGLEEGGAKEARSTFTLLLATKFGPLSAEVQRRIQAAERSEIERRLPSVLSAKTVDDVWQ